MVKKTFLQPFLAIGFLVAAIFITLQVLPVPWQKRSQAEKLTDSIFPRITKEEAGKIYSMLKICDGLFQENAIPYWIDGVTLLGAVRHKGLVPWEKGAELYIYQADSAKLLSLKSLLEEHDLELIPHKQGFRLQLNSSPDLSVDIFFAVKDVAAKKIYTIGSNKLWKEEELLPTAKLPFGPLELFAPNHPLSHLRELYGNGVMEKAFDLRDFRTGHPLPPSEVEVVDYSPAQYETFHL